MKETRWGILGCGHIAEKFAQDLQQTEGAILQAVGSRSLEKAKAFGEEFEALEAFGSYEELAQSSAVDIIYVATPHMFHKEHTLLCLKNKKAVLCEKAFGMNLEEVAEMCAFAKAEKLFLMEALWTHFLPHYNYALETVHSGNLGKIKSLKADFGIDPEYNPEGRLFNKGLGGGSLLDVGIYPVFAALSMLGYTDNIKAEGKLGPTGVDHSVSIVLDYGNDVTAQLYCAIDEKTDTICTIELEFGKVLINSRFHEPSAVTVIAEGRNTLKEFPVNVNGYHYEILHCQEMLAQGKTESSIMTFEKSKQLMMLLDGIRNQIGLKY
ncbi:gfo/Idh/MocA family oxidoreductase [Dokdonia sinensis]|uniref:Gfo/Idh/MocA family oxidoreductase n=2 Tax=Dokdonia sinensis TaxID=2479847 RepID=A0A3M0FUB1_9FLAO|nr:gfo/Idh/MocA family oxidoreductase [Dokdonia sinensis]